MDFGFIIVVVILTAFLVSIAVKAALVGAWPFFCLAIILIAAFSIYAVQEFKTWRKK
jgi:hypothetical protein